MRCNFCQDIKEICLSAASSSKQFIFVFLISKEHTFFIYSLVKIFTYWRYFDLFFFVILYCFSSKIFFLNIKKSTNYKIIHFLRCSDCGTSLGFDWIEIVAFGMPFPLQSPKMNFAYFYWEGNNKFLSICGIKCSSIF